MIEPSLQLGGGNWANKSDSLLGYHKDGANFYADELTFSRNSLGSYTDANGLVQSMPYNLATYSEQFDNAAWTKNGTTVVSGFASPNGNNNAFKLVEDSSNAIHRIYQTSTVYASPNASISVFIKYNGRQYILIRFADQSVGRWYDLINGTLGNTYVGTPNDSTITSVGDGWYRITLSNTSNAQARCEFWVSDTQSVSAYQGDGTSGVYIYGAQLNQGSTALPYFATTTRLNLARVDYKDNVNGSLLLEPQRTNSFTFSENINNFSTLGRLNCGYTLGGSFGGFNTSCLITSTSFTGSLIRGVLGFNSVNLQNNYFTIRVKKKSGWYLNVIGGNGCAGGDLKINLASGGGYISSSGTMLTDYKVNEFDDYFQIGFKTTQNATTAAGLINLIFYDNASFANYNDAGGTTFNVSGIQWENQQTYGTSYIKSEGAATTRLADSCYKTGISDKINSVEGVLYAEMASLSDISPLTASELTISDGTLSNNIRLLYSPSTSLNSLFVRIDVGGVRVATFNYTGVTITNLNKFAVKWKVNDFALWVNGTEVLTNLSGTSFAASTLSKFAFTNAIGGDNLFANIQNLMVFPSALSDTELATLTTL